MGEGRRSPDPDPLQNELVEAQMSYELFSDLTPGLHPFVGIQRREWGLIHTVPFCDELGFDSFSYGVGKF